MDILSLLSADNYHDRFYRPPSPSSPSSSFSSSDTHLNDSHDSCPDSRSPILHTIQLNSRSESCCAAFIGLDLNSNGVVKLDDQLKDESICGICKEEREDERGDERWYELEVEAALGLVLPSRREDMRLMDSKSRSRSRSTSRSRNSYPNLDLSSTGSNEYRTENENEKADESEHSENPHPQKRRRKSTPTPTPSLTPKSKTKPPTKTKIPIPPEQLPHTQTPTPNPNLENQIRRRAQLRTAQATYRLRRDLTIAHLRKEVSLLENTQVEMRELLVQLWGELRRRGVLESGYDDEGGEGVGEEMEGDRGERRERAREVEEFFKRLNDMMAMNGLERMETT
ncbi:hypothetical protein BKA61DRAFT_86970 [Leptodontidium sp. MPI-SDFR-AT-0119]|nr:hypothetical protein BKA61DRAFT_86970 [Leptodontidium sp. MPI-SDFR-AT-0119]